MNPNFIAPVGARGGMVASRVGAGRNAGREVETSGGIGYRCLRVSLSRAS